MPAKIDFNDYFYYDETSPSCLRWKVDRRAGTTGKGRLMSVEGGEAGGLGGSGYYVVMYNRHQYYAHRVIWEMFNYPIPEKFVVDHIDGCRGDSRISNLRCVPIEQNLRNANRRANNSSGVTGVCLSTINKSLRWTASWWTLGVDRKRMGKSFSVEALGNEEAFRLACEYRAKMIAELNDLGACYSDRHGTGLPFHA